MMKRKVFISKQTDEKHACSNNCVTIASVKPNKTDQTKSKCQQKGQGI